MRFKKFENFINVGPDFKKNIKTAELLSKRKKDIYNSSNITQLKVDLFYGIKWQIRDWLKYEDDKTQESYENFLNVEIYDDKNDSGVLRKYSGIKYNNIELEDLQEVKSILWKYINEIIPYDEVDYDYQYGLGDKIDIVLDKFFEEIQEKNFWK